MMEGGRQGEREGSRVGQLRPMLHVLARELCSVVLGKASPNHPSHGALSVSICATDVVEIHDSTNTREYMVHNDSGSDGPERG